MTQMIEALLLAAGSGTRLRPVTDTIPKPMVSIAGKPILAHNVELLARHGITQIAINLHHRPDVIRDYFGDGRTWGVRITYSYEPKPLGTAGAVRKLSSDLADEFLVVYGDNVTDCDLTELRDVHTANDAACTVAVHSREDPSTSGVAILDNEDRIKMFVEKPGRKNVGSNWVSAGVLLVEKTIVRKIPPGVSDWGRDVLPTLLEQGDRVFGYRINHPITWIDTPDDYRRALSRPHNST